MGRKMNYIAIILTILFVFANAAQIQAAVGCQYISLQIDNPKMVVDGQDKEIDPGKGTKPVLVEGRTMVPIRAIIEAMGGTIDWISSENKVTLKLNEKEINLWISKKAMKINGKDVQNDVAPIISNGRTLLPLRFVSENLGYLIAWNDSLQEVIIYKEGMDIAKINIEDLKRRITEASNKTRLANNLPALTRNSSLDALADKRARDLVLGQKKDIDDDLKSCGIMGLSTIEEASTHGSLLLLRLRPNQLTPKDAELLKCGLGVYVKDGIYYVVMISVDDVF